MASSAPTPVASDETIWPLRTWVLAITASLFALAIKELGDQLGANAGWQDRFCAAGMLFLATGGVAFGLSWERGRLVPALLVSVFCAIVAASVSLWSGAPGRFTNGEPGWYLFCGLIAATFILTIFQAAQDSGAGRPAVFSVAGLRDWKRAAVAYADVHGHLWTNGLLIGLSLLFAGLSFAIAHLMAEMFGLVKLDFLKDALRKDWFLALLLGAAFGAGVGLLRDRGTIIRALQRVAMVVLRVLAPVVAVAILVFLVALPFTGLAPLWATGGTTPIMLMGAMLALFLANAVVGDSAVDESRSRVLRLSAAALGLVLLPMVGIAAFSSGLRIQQYGLSPDRLWALTFIIVASITAVAYAVAILGRQGWFVRLRRTNLHLVFLLGSIALLLSTPLLGFERIATAHQLARLKSGAVSAQEFDYKGLWFDFGPPGREAIAQLAKHSTDKAVQRYAAETQKLKVRWDEAPNQDLAETGAKLDKRLTILPEHLPLDDKLRKRLISYDACGQTLDACTLYYVQGQDHAVVIAEPSAKCESCKPRIHLLTFAKGDWSEKTIQLSTQDDTAVTAAAVRAGRVEMRPVQRRQLFIGGKPYGTTLPLPNENLPDEDPQLFIAAPPLERGNSEAVTTGR